MSVEFSVQFSILDMAHGSKTVFLASMNSSWGKKAKTFQLVEHTKNICLPENRQRKAGTIWTTFPQPIDQLIAKKKKPQKTRFSCSPCSTYIWGTNNPVSVAHHQNEKELRYMRQSQTSKLWAVALFRTGTGFYTAKTRNHKHTQSKWKQSLAVNETVQLKLKHTNRDPWQRHQIQSMRPVNKPRWRISSKHPYSPEKKRWTGQLSHNCRSSLPFPQQTDWFHQTSVQGFSEWPPYDTRKQK